MNSFIHQRLQSREQRQESWTSAEKPSCLLQTSGKCDFLSEPQSLKALTQRSKTLTPNPKPSANSNPISLTRTRNLTLPLALTLTLTQNL